MFVFFNIQGKNVLLPHKEDMSICISHIFNLCIHLYGNYDMEFFCSKQLVYSSHNNLQKELTLQTIVYNVDTPS